MKKEVSPVLAGIIILVFACIVGFFVWKNQSSQSVYKGPPPGPIKLPPSQVGTKLGGQTLGETYGSPAPQGK